MQISAPFVLGSAVVGLCATLAAVGVYSLIKPVNVAQALARGNYEFAAEILEQSKKPLSPNRALVLANLYYVGLGVAQDFAKASELYEHAALRGNAAAQYNLGLLYHHGLGVEQDRVQAAAWFLLADSGDISSADTYLRSLSGSMNPNSIQQAQNIRDSLAKTIESGVTVQ